MAIMISIIIFLIYLLCVPRRIEVKAMIRSSMIMVRAEIGFLFGLVGIPFNVSAEYRPSYGIVLFIGKRKHKTAGEQKPKNRTGLIKYIRIKQIDVNCSVGIRDDPAVSVMLSGIVKTILTQTLLLLTGKDQQVCVFPCFTRSAFSINVHGIAFVVPVKIILEEIKLKRRNKNESPNRKHYAVVHGAYQKAR